MGDERRPRLARIEAAAGAIALARALRARWGADERVGILLPSSVAGALVNVAAALSGRVSVNLNYTAGAAALGAAARLAALRTVVTSRAFLEKARVALPDGVEPIWIEDVAGGIGRAARARALLLALAAPARAVERACGAARPPSPSDTATIVFSSGTTGEPKGVEITHANLLSNIEGTVRVLNLHGDQRVLGNLPLFHSFGVMANLWYPLVRGLALVYQPNPLDGQAVGALVARYGVTFLLAPPTFLQVYLRACRPEQLASLRVVITGAERLPPRLADAFEERFGIRPLEGYGVTECSPVIAVNAPDDRARGADAAGARAGTVGRAIPGVAVRVDDPATLEPLPPDAPGMLLVNGPNVMRGYLGRPDLTRAAMRGDWYVTGDIASIDRDGFITIRDRLSRFAKIAGEMVPHGAVEEALQRAAGVDESAFAVTSLSDERKGERLAVLHTLEPAAIPGVLHRMRDDGLPNLFIPRADAFVSVAALPLLGSGKVDLRRVRSIAAEALAPPAAAGP
jgi:acyl-[acyl-carrier-protein]-phospholipid O-acyltransferase/long-chain-fatty-acid--[acyl-carrier-protein] ligase